MKGGQGQSQTNQKENVDLSWLDTVDPEIEQHLLPIERTILAALRRYRTIVAGNPTSAARVPPKS